MDYDGKCKLLYLRMLLTVCLSYFTVDIMVEYPYEFSIRVNLSTEVAFAIQETKY